MYPTVAASLGVATNSMLRDPTRKSQVIYRLQKQCSTQDPTEYMRRVSGKKGCKKEYMSRSKSQNDRFGPGLWVFLMRGFARLRVVVRWRGRAR
jgi:hypothetical protein